MKPSVHPAAPDAHVRTHVVALIAAAATLGLVAILYLGPFALRDIRFPIGFDAAYYVRTANAAGFDGLDRLGVVRSGGALLTAVLMRASGQTAFTVIAQLTAVLSGVASLGAAAMVRAGLGLRPAWVPVIGFLLWASFGYNEIYLHLDNLVNAALILAGFGAAVAVASWKRGMWAVLILFCAAGLAHWPFYVFSMAVYLLAVLLFVLPILRARMSGGDRSLRVPMELVIPAGISGAFVGATFLAPPPAGGIGVRVGSDLLRRRFFLRLETLYRYYAVPLAALGVVAAIRKRDRDVNPEGRRFFLSLMVAWLATTVVAAVAQVAGIPTAGGRLLNFLFPVPILAGVGVWWLARSLLGASMPRRAAVGAATAVVGAAMIGFGLLAWDLRYPISHSFEVRGVEQAVNASVYLAEHASGRPVYYVLTAPEGRGPPYHSWNTIRASLPPAQVPRSSPYLGTPDAFLAGAPSRGFFAYDTTPDGDGVGILLQRFNRAEFERWAEAEPERVVSTGVLAITGPELAQPIPPQPVRAVRTSVPGLAGVFVWLCAVLFLAGSGWSLALLPADATLRVSLAPALGAATVVLAALAWDRAGLPLGGVGGLGPLALAAVGGWALHAFATLRRRRGHGLPPAGERTGRTLGP